MNLILNKTGVNEAMQIYGAVMYDVIYTVQDGLMIAIHKSISYYF